MSSIVSADMASRFRILATLGSGAFGAVYEAVDTRTGQRVALKVLDDMSASSIARFKHEFRALSDCHHENLVSLKELIEDDGRWTIVMELVPGCDFLTFVRGPAENDNRKYDEARLRSALLGISRGLIALHSFGALHRDLKPSNVRVTPEGRAVLLDFGLVTSADPSQQSMDVGLLGTAPYMAPEQATRSNVGASADWYAFGTCLFEALTGRLPFTGETLYDILNKKQTHAAPRASSLCTDLPADLDELCARLLERDPEQRAGARDVLAVLGSVIEFDEGADRAERNSLAPPPFAGRATELRQLERALSRAEQGSLRLVLVEGESGVGKTELVTEFVRRTRLQQSELLTLQGRCYENEQVSYKAFDGCIDELSRFLQRLPERTCAHLLPPRATLLGQLFPMLRGVRAIAMAPHSEPSADPSARRLEAFAALAALLKKLAEERPVVLLLDDLQWADAESFRLLLALMEDPEPPPVLIVATIRPPEELDAEVSAGVESLRRKQRMDVIPILGLPEQEAAELARRLLGLDAVDEYCELIAAESGGHPLFLSELVRFVRSHDLTTRGALSLEAALRARMDRLDGRACELLEIVALAGRPHGSHIFAAALGVDDVDDAARTLLAAKLLRLRKHQELGCYHDRIRHTAVRMIAQSRLPALHSRLATALSSDPESDAFEQAQHWDLAGDQVRAFEAYAQAAEAAYDALAFIRAAELCTRAMRLLGDDRNERAHRLLVLQANALACAGRSTEAASRYERAAIQARGQQRYQLRALHAEQLLMSGKLESGVAAMRALLGDLGVSLPRSLLAMMLQIAGYRLWLRLRGHGFVPREVRPGEEQLALTADVIGTFSHAVSPTHPVEMMLLTLRMALLVFKVPRPDIVLRLHGALGWLYAISGSPRASQAMFDRAHQLAPSVDSDVAKSHMLLAEGSARLVTWELPLSAPALEQAQHILQTRCPEQPALLRNVRYHLGLAWYALGKFERIARETDRWIAEARERNDALTVALIAGMGYGFLRHLMRDAPEAALAEIDGAMRELPAEPYSFVHFGALMVQVTTLLYMGGPAAHEWLGAHLDGRPTPMLLRSQVCRLRVSTSRGQAALRALEGAEPKQRIALLKIVRREGRWLLRDRSMARTHGHLLLAQLHALEGRRDEALTAARAACTEASSHEGTLGKLAQYLEAMLDTEEPDNARAAVVLHYFREQGWQRPTEFLCAMLPGIPQLFPSLGTSTSVRLAERRLLEQYETVRTIAGGGFGTVVEAIDTRTGHAVALKELVSRHPRSLERFKQEFRELRAVNHANLVHLEALIEHAGTWYIAMELLRGEPLVAYCRPGGVLDPDRLRGAFVGLCSGLSALHHAGFAHRDVTSDNVCVTDDGRAVLLDFGLIGRLEDERDLGTLGTVEYAAPEQLEGSPPGTAADVYALGTCLYQALSGTLPFSAHVPALALRRKRNEAPPPLRISGCEDLAQLALDMLARDPAARPALPAVKARLQGTAVAAHETLIPAAEQVSVPFSGRESELERLQAAFESTCDDGLRVVLVEGESGLGKSALMSEFGRLTEASVPNLIVLKGRCYESERVAFKAFDSAVDQLARALRALPAPACEGLLPKRASLLAQLFPVLGTVPAIAQASKRGIPADPGVRQRAAIACFVELLTRLCGTFELLFLIDDLQWADSESFRLLRTLYEQGSELPLLVVCTVRPTAETAPDVGAELASLRARSGTEVIALGGLPEASATRMIFALTGGSPSPASVARLLHEANGHPLFLRELVEQERCGTVAPEALTLDSALRQRIQSFDPRARTLLSLVALAGKPYGMHVFARAMHGTAASREQVVALLGCGLLRYSGSDGLAIYHDRIARVTRALLTPEETRRLAGDLAAALEAEAGAEASDRARLWDAAGEVARATSAYEEAGARALEALQFVAAAHHYARALELLADGAHDRRRALLAARGDALARAGQSAEAARAYQAAAEGAEGQMAARLRTLVGEQAIQSAQADWGLSTARALLAELGIPLPKSQGAAILRLAWDRVAVSWRGTDARKPARPASLQTRMQLDAAWSLAMPISWLDPVTGAALTAQHLRIALASGEPTHTARALAAEAFAQTLHASFSRPKVDSLLKRARELARKHGDPALAAEIDYREGTISTFRWDLPRARECLEQALHAVTEHCPDQPWLTTNIRLALGPVWFNLAEHAQMAQASEAWLADARDRGDKFALTSLFGLGYGFVAELMADAPEQVLAHVAQHSPLWPSQPFSFVHFGDLVATAYTLNYRGGAQGWEWFERELPRLLQARLLERGTGRAIFLSLCTVAALAAWADARGERARALLVAARKLAADLSKVRSAFAMHTAPFFKAQIQAIEGDRERALIGTRRVLEAAQASGSIELVHHAQYFEATLEGGQRGHETRAQLLASYSEQGWKRPERALALLCPVSDRID